MVRAVHERLIENRAPGSPWYRWGPYLSERQWGTVREDYSEFGTAWDYLPHDDARSRAYRWGEDGLFGLSDRHGLLCFSVALWNGKDPILKERLFGLTNSQGNHGEDVKELYYYLDCTPTHCYMKALYKYPQAAYPYDDLVGTNAVRSKTEREYEIEDTGVFDEDRYFDVRFELAKVTPDDLLVRLTVTNHGPEEASLVLLPQLCFRNRWSWEEGQAAPQMKAMKDGWLAIGHPRYGERRLLAEGKPELLFTENDTNTERLFGTPNKGPFVKDAFHRHIVSGEKSAVNTKGTGSKAGLRYDWHLQPGETRSVRLRLTDLGIRTLDIEEAEAIFEQRIAEADAFFDSVSPGLPPEESAIHRQALAGLLWSKQFYHYGVARWLDGDPAQPPPPEVRKHGRNADWRHFHSAEVLSMPDKWEYPWFASWDLAFHCISLSLVDAQFAKQQLILLLREWYMHPNGQIPAYEWAFGDVNPPVHAWAAWRVFTIDQRMTGHADHDFLKRVFHKLLLNFTWWVNRKDAQGNNVFEGGFLGLDNIGVFDRNLHLVDGSRLEQSDGTSWMAMYCLNMLTIALELAKEDPSYEDVASKFLEHFLYIAKAINESQEGCTELWNDEDGFYYDVLSHPNGNNEYLRVRSMVGLIPLFAVTTLEPDTLTRFDGFRARMDWFLEHKPEMMQNVASMEEVGKAGRRLLSLVTRERLERLLQKMLDETEFLSDYGLRSVSKFHELHPFMLTLDGQTRRLDYEPGESTTIDFGGNSNWRGPIWFPVNYLMIESLQKFDYYYGDSLKVEYPKDSGQKLCLSAVAADIEQRLLNLFLPKDGKRPCFGGKALYEREANRQLLLFNEYFHGDTGRGLGAAHQTGWTGLIAKIVQQLCVTNPSAGRPGSD